MPKVSVIIPSYNRAKLLGRAIDSVLHQTFSDYEIIVVDDGSKDNTKDVLKAYDGKIKYIYQANRGISGARNQGIKEARGEYIAFLDSDDSWIPEKLAEQIKVLEANKNVGIVYSKLQMINDKGEHCGVKPKHKSGKNFRELIEIGGDIPTSSVMARRECFEKVGVFDESLQQMEDIDMWIRIAKNYDLYEITDKILAYYYRHDEQVTRNRMKVYEGLVGLYTKILNSYEDAPKAVLTKKIAMNQYTLSRDCYANKLYTDSWRHVVAAIARYPLVGALFFYEGDHVLSKGIKLIKPYGFLAVCALRLPFSKAQKVFGISSEKRLKGEL